MVVIDLPATSLTGRLHERAGNLAIHMDRASPAGGNATAEFCAGQAKLFADDPKQRRIWLGGQADCLAVDRRCRLPCCSPDCNSAFHIATRLRPLLGRCHENRCSRPSSDPCCQRHGLARARRWRLATVVETWKSAPCPTGTHMLVHADGRFVGSVSGGCVEGDVSATSQPIGDC